MVRACVRDADSSLRCAHGRSMQYRGQLQSGHWLRVCEGGGWHGLLRRPWLHVERHLSEWPLRRRGQHVLWPRRVRPGLVCVRPRFAERHLQRIQLQRSHLGPSVYRHFQRHAARPSGVQCLHSCAVWWRATSGGVAGHRRTRRLCRTRQRLGDASLDDRGRHAAHPALPFRSQRLQHRRQRQRHGLCPRQFPRGG
jgi:hypothetical protein